MSEVIGECIVRKKEFARARNFLTPLLYAPCLKVSFACQCLKLYSFTNGNTTFPSHVSACASSKSFRLGYNFHLQRVN